jgi:hypothetical protein
VIVLPARSLAVTVNVFSPAVSVSIGAPDEALASHVSRPEPPRSRQLKSAS